MEAPSPGASTGGEPAETHRAVPLVIRTLVSYVWLQLLLLSEGPLRQSSERLIPDYYCDSEAAQLERVSEPGDKDIDS